MISRLKQMLKTILVVMLDRVMRLEPKISSLKGEAMMRRVRKKGLRCKLEGSGILIDAAGLQLGDDISIGRNFFIRATGVITIGSYSHISRNAVLHTVNHNFRGHKLPYDRDDILKPVVIGRYV